MSSCYILNCFMGFLALGYNAPLGMQQLSQLAQKLNKQESTTHVFSIVKTYKHLK